VPRLANWGYWDALKRAVRVLVAQGMTAREIAEELNRQEITTASGNRWTESTVQWALHRRLGLSTVHYTRHLPTKRRKPNGNERTPLPR
jgi:transposase